MRGKIPILNTVSLLEVCEFDYIWRDWERENIRGRTTLMGSRNNVLSLEHSEFELLMEYPRKEC